MLNDTTNSTSNFNKSADTVDHSLTAMANELAMLKTKNDLIVAAYNKMDNCHTVLKEQNNKLSDAVQLANIDMNAALGSKKNFLGRVRSETITY